jgi:hypothetical protein
MNRATLGLLLTAISTIGLLTWGFYGIKKKEKIHNRVDYIISVGQVIGGLMGVAYLVYYFLTI